MKNIPTKLNDIKYELNKSVSALVSRPSCFKKSPKIMPKHDSIPNVLI